MNRLLTLAARMNTASVADRMVGLDRAGFVACPAAFLGGFAPAQLDVARSMYELAATVAAQRVAREEAIRRAAVLN